MGVEKEGAVGIAEGVVLGIGSGLMLGDGLKMESVNRCFPWSPVLRLRAKGFLGTD